jgi:type VI secretion system protein VasG
MNQDGQRRDIDLKNTVIIMTSNAAYEEIDKLCADPETAPEPAVIGETLMPELMKYFKAAFLGRVTLVPYMPLSDGVLRQIIELQLRRIMRRVRESYRADFQYDPALIDTIASRCTETSSGARNIEKILSQTLLPELSAEVLGRLAAGEIISRICVSMDASGGFCYHIN